MTTRVLIYGINYAPEIAGVGRYSGEIGAHMARLGCDVQVITAPPHYPSWTAQPPYSPRRWARERLEGATVLRCPIWLHPDMRGFRRLVAPLSFALSSAVPAAWRIMTWRPHLIIAVEPTLLVAPIAVALGKLSGSRLVLHVQDLEADAAFAVGHLKGGVLRRLALAFERRMLAGFDQVITISGRMADRLAAKGVAAERLRIVRNWVDLDQIHPLEGLSPYRRELAIADDAFVALYAGALGAKQGLQVLIDAAAALQRREDIVFVVAGEGPMKAELQRAAKRLPNLKVLNFQPPDRLGDFLGLADAHLMLQERDAADLVLPSKLGGMLASGRQILVTAERETELARFLDGACILAPPGDPAALAAAIVRLANRADPDTSFQARLEKARSLSKKTLIADFVAAAAPPAAEAPPLAFSEPGSGFGDAKLDGRAP
jgi:putative colanic acid biosynthesis glycosyltransferase WcaI